MGAEVSAAPLRVAVIGAGAVGSSSALHLRRAGHEVDVFDHREPGMGASFGNAGIIATSEVLPLGRPSIVRQLPRMLLDRSGPLAVRWRYLPQIAPWLARLAIASRQSDVSRIGEALATLLEPALTAWQEILKGTGAETRLIQSGWLRVYDTREGFERAKPDIELQRRLGVDIKLIGPDELADLEPALARAFAGATYCPGVGHLNSPIRTLEALAARLIQEGGRIHRRAIASIESKAGQTAITGEDGRRESFDRIVVAAGAWSKRLVRQVGFNAMLDTERGYHVMLSAPVPGLRRPVTVANPGYSLVPMEDGIRVTSGVEFAGLEAPPDFRRVHRMARHATTIVPGLNGAIRSEWLGFRPSMPRSLPVIGRVPGAPNVVAAFGHGHLGLTLGPITGRLVAEIVDRRTPTIDLAPFAPAGSSH